MQSNAKVESRQGGGKGGIFTYEEFQADIAGVMAYAREHGAATVINPDGSPYMTLCMPSAKHPMTGWD
jgi:hypothetical protein